MKAPGRCSPDLPVVTRLSWAVPALLAVSLLVSLRLGLRQPHPVVSAADLTGADLRGAVLRGARLAGAIYDRATRWPAGFRPEARGAIRISEPPIQ